MFYERTILGPFVFYLLILNSSSNMFREPTLIVQTVGWIVILIFKCLDLLKEMWFDILNFLVN